MIRLSVLYPTTDGATFDHDYYATTHLSLCLDAWNMDPKDAEIDRGMDGPYEAVAHFRFESMEAMQAAFASPDMAKIMADTANYTTITPVMQTSEIRTA